MLMNRTETLVVDNPVRRALQHWYEAPALRRLGGPLPAGSRVVEIGCGSGHGTRLVLDYFGAAHVDAVDLNPQMVGKAERRLRPDANRVRWAVGDATDLQGVFGAGEAAYDAAFDFAVVHHIEDWRAALAEIARVLRAGGLFYFEEVTAHALARPSYRGLFVHPERDRFTAEEFLDELPRHGLWPLGSVTRIRGDYLFGAARRLRIPPLDPGPGETRIIRVLVVEDEQSVAEGLAFLLRGHGFVVEWAPVGPLALRLFDQFVPDLVLLDLLQPGLAGLDVARALRRRSSVPIIMVTARDSPQDRSAGLAAGADQHWTTPYSIPELVSTILAVMARRAQQPMVDRRTLPAASTPRAPDGAPRDRAARGRTRRGPDGQRRDELLDRIDPRKQGRASSKGNRQRVPPVAALDSDGELLLQDEPHSGLDPLMEAQFRQVIAEDLAERGRTVLAVQPHPGGGRGAVRSGHHHPRRPGGIPRNARAAAAPDPYPSAWLPGVLSCLGAAGVRGSGLPAAHRGGAVSAPLPDRAHSRRARLARRDPMTTAQPASWRRPESAAPRGG